MTSFKQNLFNRFFDVRRMWFETYFKDNPRIKRWIIYLYIIDFFLIIFFVCKLVFHKFKSMETLSILALLGTIIMLLNSLMLHRLFDHLMNLTKVKTIPRKIISFIYFKIFFNNVFWLIGFCILISILICYFLYWLSSHYLHSTRGFKGRNIRVGITVF